MSEAMTWEEVFKAVSQWGELRQTSEAMLREIKALGGPPPGDVYDEDGEGAALMCWSHERHVDDITHRYGASLYVYWGGDVHWDALSVGTDGGNRHSHMFRSSGTTMKSLIDAQQKMDRLAQP